MPKTITEALNWLTTWQGVAAIAFLVVVSGWTFGDDVKDVWTAPQRLDAVEQVADSALGIATVNSATLDQNSDTLGVVLNEVRSLNRVICAALELDSLEDCARR